MAGLVTEFIVELGLGENSLHLFKLERACPDLVSILREDQHPPILLLYCFQIKSLENFLVFHIGRTQRKAA